MPQDSDLYDFFVSYARRDNTDGWISDFVNELLAEHRKFSGGRELVPFFDLHDIHSLDDWEHRLHEGLNKSRLFIAFLSPAYFASEWCRREWRTWIDLEIAKHILSAGAAPIHFVEVPGFVMAKGLTTPAMLSEKEVAMKVAELCALPPPHDGFLEETHPVVRQFRRRQITSDFVKPLQDDGVNALRRADLRQVLARLAHDLDDRVQDVRRAAKSANTVPPYNRKFSGRLHELLDLRKRLKDDRAGVISGIHGLGGIGKTELAFTYAHAFASAYPGGRFLIGSEGKSSLRDALLGQDSFICYFRDSISDEERKSVEAYFAALLRCLRERIERFGHVLLVLDNATDPALLRAEETDQLTSIGPMLHLLATTRLPPVGQGDWLTLGELPIGDAKDLLEKHRPFASDADREAAGTISRRLGGFALAVELVAAWLAAHPSATYAELADGLGLEDLNEFAEDEDVELRRHNHERRLRAVLEPTLAGLSPAERRTLDFAALLPPDHVALPWLKTLVTREFPDLAKPHRLGDIWDDLCRHLMRLALISRSDGESTDSRIVRCHRLIQDLVSCDWTKRVSIERQRQLDSLINELDTALQQTIHWEHVRWQLEPLHFLALKWVETEHPKGTWLCNQVGSHWRILAEWTHAENLLRRALTVATSTTGELQADTAALTSNLGLILLNTDRLAEAEQLLTHALAIGEKTLGQRDPQLAVLLNNLASFLVVSHRLPEAEILMRRGLAIDEHAFGAEHQNVSRHLRNLGKLLKDTDRLGEAEDMLRRALKIDEQSFPPNHPRIAHDLSSLAHLLHLTQRLPEAEVLLKRELEIVQQNFGGEHPAVASALSGLAQVLEDTNRLAEAEPLMRRSLSIDERCFGNQHHSVARDLYNLGGLLHATNRLDEAEPLLRRALAIDEKSFGHQHPEVAKDLLRLVNLLAAREHWDEAVLLTRRALRIDEKWVGIQHLDYARTLNTLACLLLNANRSVEAEPAARQVAVILLDFTKRTGQRLPILSGVLGNYAAIVMATGMTEPQVRQRVSDLLAEYGMSWADC